MVNYEGAEASLAFASSLRLTYGQLRQAIVHIWTLALSGLTCRDLIASTLSSDVLRPQRTAVTFARVYSRRAKVVCNKRTSYDRFGTTSLSRGTLRVNENSIAT